MVAKGARKGLRALVPYFNLRGNIHPRNALRILQPGRYLGTAAAGSQKTVPTTFP
ncbi:MAG TPA: hypothetical protein VJ960_09110 [Oceanipulchritudo sp.]|nr:hypothetical protein [Oceanipulchritudo sp.]